MAESVKVLDAGSKLMLSGPTSAEVEAVLNDYLKRGAKLVAPVSLVGRNWVATCTLPPTNKALDDTQTLYLADVAAASRSSAKELDDGCRVEELGFKRLVYGPSRLAVHYRVEEMKQFGAELIGEIEEVNGEWVAVCDTAGAQNTGYRW